MRESPRSRAGSLILMVGVGLAALGIGVFAFQYVSSSDRAQVRKVLRELQGQKLLELATMELHDSLEAVQGSADAAQPKWVAPLLDELDRARPGRDQEAPQELAVKRSMDLLSELPLTQGAAREMRAGLELVAAKLEVGPFEVLTPYRSPALHYREPLLDAPDADARAWDLRGDLRLSMTLRSRAGTLEPAVTFSRTERLDIVDTAAPAAEFALCSYLRPPTEDHALNDLQRGGRFTVFPNADGRVMVRGPLVLLPEDGGGGPPELGGPVRLEESLNYPDREAGGQWTGWAAIPGPRALQYPALYRAQLETVEFVLNLFVRLVGQDPINFVNTSPRRPTYPDTSTSSAFKLVSVLLFAGVSNPAIKKVRFAGVEVGLNVPLFDEPVIFFPSSEFVHGPLPIGQQLFSVMGLPDAVPPKPRESTDRDLYRAVLLPLEDESPPSVHAQGAVLPDSPEGALLAMEPLPNRELRSDEGILGLYGWARFTQWVVFSVDFWEAQKCVTTVLAVAGGPTVLLKKLVELAIEKFVTKLLGYKPVLRLQAIRHATKPTFAWPAGDELRRLRADQLHEAIEEGTLLLKPYGLYAHHDRFLEHPVLSLLKDWIVRVGKSLLSSVADLAGEFFCGLKIQTTSPEGQSEMVTLINGPDARRGMWKPIRFLTRRLKDVLGTATQKAAVGKVARPFIEPNVEEVLELLVSRGYTMAASVAREEARLPDLDSVRALYPSGIVPPGHRDWSSLVTRWYPDVKSWVEDRTRDGVVVLDGVAGIRSPEYSGPPLLYAGRGIVVLVTEVAAQPARIAASVGPEKADRDHLTLVHLVTPEIFAGARTGGPIPSLKLGETFTGSVVTTTGVAPAGTRTAIAGNLVTGWINKSGIPESLRGRTEGVAVTYSPRLAEEARGSRIPYWRASVVRAGAGHP